MSTSAEHQVREGAPPNDGPLEGAPGPSAETDRDAPTGMPTDEMVTALAIVTLITTVVSGAGYLGAFTRRALTS